MQGRRLVVAQGQLRQPTKQATSTTLPCAEALLSRASEQAPLDQVPQEQDACMHRSATIKINAAICMHIYVGSIGSQQTHGIAPGTHTSRRSAKLNETSHTPPQAQAATLHSSYASAGQLTPKSRSRILELEEIGTPSNNPALLLPTPRTTTVHSAPRLSYQAG